MITMVKILKKMSSWLVERKREQVLVIVQKHLALTIDAVRELEHSVSLCTGGTPERIADARKALRRLDQVEIAADELRRKTMRELVRSQLTVEEKELLMHLMRELDRIADRAKDCGRILDVLIPLRAPKEFVKTCEKMCELSVECASSLESLIKGLGSISQSETLALCSAVEELEEEVDDLYAVARREILTAKGSTGYVVLLSQFVAVLETVTDSCEDAADVVRLVVTTARLK